jgi:Rrf2 family transcriptional regulator, nitric oxide-sensitive transcriptional repressor
MYCAVNNDRTVRKIDLAQACNASENHLAQVIRILAHNGFIDATRGRHGGMRLMRPAHLINIGAVFRLFEADMPFAECFGRHNTCPLISVCWLRGAISDAVEAFYRSLDRVHLSDLVTGNNGLSEMLTLATPAMRVRQCDVATRTAISTAAADQVTPSEGLPMSTARQAAQN